MQVVLLAFSNAVSGVFVSRFYTKMEIATFLALLLIGCSEAQDADTSSRHSSGYSREDSGGVPMFDTRLVGQEMDFRRRGVVFGYTTLPEPRRGEFDDAVLALCGAPRIKNRASTIVTAAMVQTLFESPAGKPVFDEIYDDTMSLVQRGKVYLQSGTNYARRFALTATTVPAAPVLSAGMSKTDFLPFLAHVWTDLRGFEHVFCGEFYREDASRTIAGLHYVHRYAELNSVGSAVVSRAKNDGIVFNFRPVLTVGGVRFSKAVSGFSYISSAADIFREGSHAFFASQNTVGDNLLDPRRTFYRQCVATTKDAETGTTMWAMILRQQKSDSYWSGWESREVQGMDAIRSFYHVLSPGDERVPSCY